MFILLPQAELTARAWGAGVSEVRGRCVQLREKYSPIEW